MKGFIETREMMEDSCGPTLFAKDDGYEGTISLAMRKRSGNRQSEMASNITFSPIKEGEAICSFLTLQKPTIQNLFNQLWQLGFRPKDGTGNSVNIEAIKYHLEDMRTIVFKDMK